MRALAGVVGDQAVALCAFDGKQGQLVSARAFAPGQPLSLALTEGAPCTLQLKSLGSVKQPEGGFVVRVRALSMPRDLRERLVAHFRAPA